MTVRLVLVTVRDDRTRRTDRLIHLERSDVRGVSRADAPGPHEVRSRRMRLPLRSLMALAPVVDTPTGAGSDTLCGGGRVPMGRA